MLYCSFSSQAFPKTKGAAVLTTLIVLATVFLKQHTLVDVIAAAALNLVCYQLLYKPRAVHAEKPARV
jgi:membrane-associated phospholipid phosphatase